MFRLPLAAAVIFAASAAAAYDIDAILDRHVIPGFTDLAAEAEDLKGAAEADCSATSAPLRDAYNDAFDAWMRVSHLRFGPTEQGDRAFALAFWPDSKGFTPRTLAGLIEAEDPVIDSQDSFATLSIAARGFYALEYLLYDDVFTEAEPEGYRCALVQAVARDIAAISDAILEGWTGGYADLMREPGSHDRYRSREDVAQEFFKAVLGGLQFTSDTRLGRPLGTFDRPRPNRAEARRSGRSLRNVRLSVEGAADLALLLAEDAPYAADKLLTALDRVRERAEALKDDPALAGAADPQGRLEIEILQQDIDALRRVVASELGPELGVSAGFNAMDGD